MNQEIKSPELPGYDHQPKPYTGPSYDEVMALRKRYLTPSLLTFYKKPIMIVEGSMQYLYDEKGNGIWTASVVLLQSAWVTATPILPKLLLNNSRPWSITRQFT